jgi:hypothetical protein
VAAATELQPFPRAVPEPCFAEAYKYYDELADVGSRSLDDIDRKQQAPPETAGLFHSRHPDRSRAQRGAVEQLC